MDIAAASMAMSQSNVMQQVSTNMLKRTMDTAEQTAKGILEMAPPAGKLDVRA